MSNPLALHPAKAWSVSGPDPEGAVCSSFVVYLLRLTYILYGLSRDCIPLFPTNPQ